MKDRRTTMIAALVASVIFVSCTDTSQPPGASDPVTQEEVALTRDTLTAAVESARAYGQAHLGHYLDLSAKRLQRRGLEVPSSISLTVRTRHNSYCIKAANEILPSIHPWALASVSSRDADPSTWDRCRRRG